MAKRARKPGRPSLSAISYASLEAEIARRNAKAGGLIRKRDRLVAQLAKVDMKLARAGIDSSAPAQHGAMGLGQLREQWGAGHRKRPRNEMNLVEALTKLLDGKTMSVTEATDAVQRAGYKSSSKTFRTIVNQTLLKPSLFKKIARGRYTAKK